MSTGTVFNLLTPKSSTFVFKLFKLVGTLTSLLMSSFVNFSFQSNEIFLDS